MAARPIDRIAIAGAGAIGGWIAAKLALAGNRVSAFGRSGGVASIRIVEGERARDVALAPSGGPADLLIVAVKAPALADAAETARTLIGPETLILPMLNGVPWWFFPGEPLRSIDPDGSIAHALPLDRVIGCAVHAACRRSGPAEVTVVHADKLILGEPRGGASERVVTLAALFESAGIRVEPGDDVRNEIWYKLWGNATLNPLSALTRATADRLLADPHLRAFMSEGMAELAAVGAAIGCPIGESAEDRMAVTARLGAFKTSMLQDVEAGRPIELEALLGAPREIARRAGIPTPQLDRLYAETRLLGESLNLL
jgi:2-dehydropantoate 2-reductase